MPLVQLTISSLEELDNGRVAKAFQAELRRAVEDCMDRPSDKNAREVVLTLKLKPIAVTDGGVTDCEGADGEFHVKSKVPTRKSKSYAFQTNKKGHLIYSSNNPEDVAQTHIDDINPATGKVER